jgi:hypothetical protein
VARVQLFRFLLTAENGLRLAHDVVLFIDGQGAHLADVQLESSDFGTTPSADLPTESLAPGRRSMVPLKADPSFATKTMVNDCEQLFL